MCPEESSLYYHNREEKQKIIRCKMLSRVLKIENQKRKFFRWLGRRIRRRSESIFRYDDCTLGMESELDFTVGVGE